MRKTNQIKGGIYRGYWNDFFSNKEAKNLGHRQERRKAKKIIAKTLDKYPES